MIVEEKVSSNQACPRGDGLLSAAKLVRWGDSAAECVGHRINPQSHTPQAP